MRSCDNGYWLAHCVPSCCYYRWKPSSLRGCLLCSLERNVWKKDVKCGVAIAIYKSNQAWTKAGVDDDVVHVEINLANCDGFLFSEQEKKAEKFRGHDNRQNVCVYLWFLQDSLCDQDCVQSLLCVFALRLHSLSSFPPLLSFLWWGPWEPRFAVATCFFSLPLLYQSLSKLKPCESLLAICCLFGTGKALMLINCLLAERSQ